MEATNITFSIIVPTIFRPTLLRTINSIATQEIVEGDEVLLGPDGQNDESRKKTEELIKQFPTLHIRHIDSGGPHKDWGNTQRNKSIGMARASHILFMDDDDIFAPNAFAIIRKAASEAPMTMHLFRASFVQSLGVIWHDKKIRCGNISTPMICVPRRDRMAIWDNQYEGDCHFIKDTNQMIGCEWHEDIIAIVRP